MVTHDLGVAAQVADRVAVMYAGRLAEVGDDRRRCCSARPPVHAAACCAPGSRSASDRTRPLPRCPASLPDPAAPRRRLRVRPAVRRSPARRVRRAAVPSRTAAGAGAPGSACLHGPAARRPTGPHESAPRPPIVSTPAEQRRARRPRQHGGCRQDASRSSRLRGRQAAAGCRRCAASTSRSPRASRSRWSARAARGKSTLLRVVAGLQPIDDGEVELADGAPPADGLPGRRRLADAVADGRRALGSACASLGRRRPGGERSRDALALVGLPPEVARPSRSSSPAVSASGSALARATVVPPEVLLCDEPTSALDVSLAATVLNLLGRLRRELGMAVLFVTHDLAAPAIVADRIAVMYLGRIVEIGAAEQMCRPRRTPTPGRCSPPCRTSGASRSSLPGEPASPLNPPTGCAFHPRCPQARPVCSRRRPRRPLVRRRERDVAALARLRQRHLARDVGRWPS